MAPPVKHTHTHTDPVLATVAGRHHPVSLSVFFPSVFLLPGVEQHTDATDQQAAPLSASSHRGLLVLACATEAVSPPLPCPALLPCPAAPELRFHHAEP